MTKSLEMTFQNAAGKNARVSVADPRDDVDAAEVQAVMDTILARNIFSTSGGDMVKAVGATVVTREVAEILPQS